MSVKELVKQSRQVKEEKKKYARKEATQVSKEIASYLCRGTRGIRVPYSKNMSVIKFDTTCSNCGNRNGSVFVIKNKRLCRNCKIKSEEKNEKI